jgi:hypothetical protein
MLEYEGSGASCPDVVLAVGRQLYMVNRGTKWRQVKDVGNQKT